MITILSIEDTDQNQKKQLRAISMRHSVMHLRKQHMACTLLKVLEVLGVSHLIYS